MIAPMLSLLFRNRWFAVAWVALTLLSASIFAGRGGGAHQIEQSIRQVQAQHKEAERPVAAPPVVIYASEAAKPPLPALRKIPGSNADPANPKPGDVFIDVATGQRVRAVKRSEYEGAANKIAPTAAPSNEPL